MKSVPIELDRLRNIRIGIKAMQTIKSVLKKPLDRVDLADVDELLTVLMIGLHHEDNSVTKDQLADWIDEHTDLETVIKATTDAILEAYGKNAKAAADAAQKQQSQMMKKTIKKNIAKAMEVEEDEIEDEDEAPEEYQTL